MTIKTIECPMCDELLTVNTENHLNVCICCGLKMTLAPSSHVHTQCLRCLNMFTTTALKTDGEKFKCTLCDAVHTAYMDGQAGWHTQLDEGLDNE